MMKIRQVSKILLSPIVWILVILFGVGLVYTGGFSFNQDNQIANPMQYKGPSAKVNGELIKDENFNKVYGPLVQNYGQMYPSDLLKDEALKRATDDMVIQQYIRKWHIKTTDSEIVQSMKKIYAGAKTPEEQDSLLSQYGVKSKGELKKLLREQLDRVNFFAELAKRWKVKISDQEVRAKYEELELAHILIATNPQVKENPLSDADALKRAQEAYEKIKAGTDFSTVAKEYSDDSTKENGGNLGRQNLSILKQQMDKDFMKAAEKLKVGQVSGPVKTVYGYHLIKLVDKKVAKGKEYNEQKDSLRRMALAEKLYSTKSDRLQRWVKSHADVEIIDPALRAFRLKNEKKWTEAAEAYSKALKMNQYKNDVAIYLSDASVLKEAKRFNEAIKVLKKFPADEQSSQQIQITMAEIYDAQGNKAKAKSILQKEVNRSTQDIDALRRISSEMKLLKYDNEAKALDNKIASIQAQLDKEQKQYEETLNKQQGSSNNTQTTGSTAQDSNASTENQAAGQTGGQTQTK
ncbi:MAG TPA: peptidylprolyl isomerase [Bacillota bacterium]|nr:peptidylprolyl isomerase [Bacillota bacterium]